MRLFIMEFKHLLFIDYYIHGIELSTSPQTSY